MDVKIIYVTDGSYTPKSITYRNVESAGEAVDEWECTVGENYDSDIVEIIEIENKE